MAIKGKGTEGHILETAKRVYLKEGRFDATTQDIADAAGVNRTLLHYYFRSRESLLEKILLDGHAEFRRRISDTIDPDASFRDRLGVLIDMWHERAVEFPYLDAFLVVHIHQGSFLDSYMNDNRINLKEIDIFLDAIETEMKNGNIPTMEPIQYLFHVLSMITYPITMRPLWERAINANKKTYSRILADRKEAILKTLLG